MKIDFVFILSFIITFFVSEYPYYDIITGLRDSIRDAQGVWIRGMTWGTFASSALGMAFLGTNIYTRCLIKHEGLLNNCGRAMEGLIASTFVNLVSTYVLWKMRNESSKSDKKVMICKIFLVVFILIYYLCKLIALLS